MQGMSRCQRTHCLGCLLLQAKHRNLYHPFRDIPTPTNEKLCAGYPAIWCLLARDHVWRAACRRFESGHLGRGFLHKLVAEFLGEKRQGCINKMGNTHRVLGMYRAMEQKNLRILTCVVAVREAFALLSPFLTDTSGCCWAVISTCCCLRDSHEYMCSHTKSQSSLYLKFRTNDIHGRGHGHSRNERDTRTSSGSWAALSTDTHKTHSKASGHVWGVRMMAGYGIVYHGAPCRRQSHRKAKPEAGSGHCCGVHCTQQISAT